MSRSLTAWSRRVSLVERSRSNFAFVTFCVQVPPLLSFPAKPLTAVSGKFRFLSAGFRTEARRRRRVVE
jgi:hypothetical protein